jgi:RNA polymerase sigma-70 factor (ECF subfamily)
MGGAPFRRPRPTKIASHGGGSRPYGMNARIDRAAYRAVDVDVELIGRAQHGDEEAFASLAVAAGDRLHAVAYRILRDTDLAEDATQQALLAIWRDLPQLRDPARFDAWSYRLLVRACYAEGRRARQWVPNLRLVPADGPVAAEGLSSIDDRDQLERGFRRLTIDHRAVVVLHHYLDLPLDEVAGVLGVPVGTVRSRLHHAMRGLRAALEADARPATQEAAR